jgi:single-strand DNA-binding protein
MINSANIVIVGNTTEDPILTFMKSGDAVASFGVAVNERVKEGDEWRDGEPTFYRVSVWRKDGEAVAETITKGQRVIVAGRMKQNTYTGKTGESRTSLEITAETVGVVPRWQSDSKPKPQAENDPWANQSEIPPF